MNNYNSINNYIEERFKEHTAYMKDQVFYDEYCYLEYLNFYLRQHSITYENTKILFCLIKSYIIFGRWAWVEYKVSQFSQNINKIKFMHAMENCKKNLINITQD